MKWISKPPLGTPLNWAHPLNKGLAGFWLFNEGMGNKAYDISGNGNHGTLTNMAFPPTATSGWNPSRKGKGLQFNGVNNYVDAGNAASLNITSAITIEARVKWTKFNANDDYQGIVNIGNTGLQIYDRSIGGAALTFHRPGVSQTYGTAWNLLSIEQWYHEMVVHLGRGSINDYNTDIYLNGVSIALTESGGGVPDYVGNIIIGKAARYFNGTIDEVRIWNRALSASEIQELYINPYGMFL